MNKKEIIKIYRSLSWEDEIPVCCTEERIFECPECGELFAICDLEIWSTDSDEDIENDLVCCSFCYEKQMGDDL